MSLIFCIVDRPVKVYKYNGQEVRVALDDLFGKVTCIFCSSLVFEGGVSN